MGARLRFSRGGRVEVVLGLSAKPGGCARAAGEATSLKRVVVYGQRVEQGVVV